MKKVLIKIPAMIAMLLTVLSMVFFVQSFTNPEAETWVLSAIVAYLCVPFYFADAIISLVKAIKKVSRAYNLILAVMLFAFIPMVVFFAGSGNVVHEVVWTVYFLAVFVMEIVSIVKCAKA